MAEGARLESVYMATYRGFESLSLCKEIMLPERGAFFVLQRVKLFNLAKLCNKKAPACKAKHYLFVGRPFAGSTELILFTACQTF